MALNSRKTHFHLCIALLGMVLATSSCSTYSKVREKKPVHKSDSLAGQLIAQVFRIKPSRPEEKMGFYIDAAAVATEVLKVSPGDPQAMKDYNFAVSRLIEAVQESNLEPWKTPVICPGVSGDWTFSMTHDGKPEHDPSHFRILPADRFVFRGKLVKDRSVKEGLGAPIVIASYGFDPTQFDPFIQGKNIYYGVTEVLHFNGRECTAAFIDPLADETVEFAGHTYPVAADFTAPLGLALAELKPRKAEIQHFLKPSHFEESTRLARLQPYDPKKIPILCIHGLGDSQATWAPMIESLRGDETIRQKYQIWFFTYPTGYPFPLMAAMLRDKMEEIAAYHKGHKPMVVIGHSMGGMIARVLMTDSGMEVWKAFFDTPPGKTPLSEEARYLLTKTLIFKHRHNISRVIFASASHRGADMATSFLGRIGRSLIGSPRDLSDVGRELATLAKPREDGVQLKRTPNSIDALDPNNRFVTTIDKLPLAKGIPYHSIIGDRGKGGNLDRTKPVSTDGIVPYWSSHMDGAESEIIIPSGHWSNQHPLAIAEIRRILMEHLQSGRK